MPNVEFRNIWKKYGALSVMENLNLSVGSGEFLVLLGPSGCGKTTLLNLLAGLQDVTGGSILIDGLDVTDLDPKDRGLAMVFQSYALYPTKSVRGNLKFGLAAQKLNSAEIDARVRVGAGACSSMLRRWPKGKPTVMMGRSSRASSVPSRGAGRFAGPVERSNARSCVALVAR